MYSYEKYQFIHEVIEWLNKNNTVQVISINYADYLWHIIYKPN